MVAILAECRGLLDARGKESLALLAHVESVLETYTSSVARACASLYRFLSRVANILDRQEYRMSALRAAHLEGLAQSQSDFANEDAAKEVLSIILCCCLAY